MSGGKHHVCLPPPSSPGPDTGTATNNLTLDTVRDERAGSPPGRRDTR